MPQAPLIMVLRHCEKPTEVYAGITKNGTESEHSLIVRGWQRAGALIRFFAPSSGPVASARLERPAFLFAASPDADGAESGDQSKREEETLGGLSDLLGIDLNLTFGKGQEKEVAAASVASDGPVLIAWDHRKIIELAKAIAPKESIPKEWPSERFDIVFAFKLQPNGTYSFSQVPQLLLAGDTDQPIF